MYSEGSTAVKQDNKTAFEWFKKAADAVSQEWYSLTSLKQIFDSCFACACREMLLGKVALA